MNRKGFDDPDLRTPAHDSIMVWLEENAAQIAMDVSGARAAYEKALNRVRDEMSARQMVVYPGVKEMLHGADMVSRISTTWEHPIRTKYGPARFIDMLIKFEWSVPVVGLTHYVPKDLCSDADAGYLLSIGGWHYSHEENAYMAHPYDREQKACVATTEPMGFVMACEVKPTIPSVGELIRQLRHYESRDWKTAVVSPDDRFRDIIEKQGFLFIKAPKPDYGPQQGLFA